jgi:Rap/ran-GAP
MQAEVDFDSDAIRAGRKVLSAAELNTLPSYIMTQTHNTDQPPLLLTDDEATLRSIHNLDRIPVGNYYGIGIAYVGWGQKTEEEILANEVGSVEYQNFLDEMGTLIRLKGNEEIYHPGLDTKNDEDGTHAIFWSDRTTQITFVTYTLIPLCKTGDKREAISSKKRNAANCYVNIIWNDSNEPYALDTVASEFNSNSIVISRHSRPSSKADTVVSSKTNPTQQFFKVKLIQMPGMPMPKISPIMDEKLISAKCLAPFVRSVALQLSIFCGIFIGKEDKSHWLARWDQIKQIRDRALQRRNSDTSVKGLVMSPSIPNVQSSKGRQRPSVASVESTSDAQLEALLSKYDFSKYT